MKKTPSSPAQRPSPSIQTGGIKRYFSSRGVPSPHFEIRGVGILEQMSPGLIERPQGTGDYLLMLFHDEAHIGTEPRWESLQPGNSMMIWPTGAAHYYGSNAGAYTHSWIHCGGRGVREMVKRSKLPILEPFVVGQPYIFQQGLSDLLAELVGYTRPDPIIVQGLFELCLRRLSRGKADTRETARVPEKLLSVQRMISSVPAEDITLDDMARMAGMSAPYFCSQFKKTFGTSPMESLIHHRLHHAAHLLTNWNLNISEIAAQVGYNDLFHFSKMFRKKFGMSPRKMRARGVERSR